MSEESIRLECLRIAKDLALRHGSTDPNVVINWARQFAAYAEGSGLNDETVASAGDTGGEG